MSPASPAVGTDPTSEDASPASGQPSPSMPAKGHRSLGNVLERYGLLLLLLAVAVFFSASPVSGPAFRSSANWLTLTANQAVTFAVALALLFPLAAGFFDFSVGAVAATSSVVAAAAMSHHALPLGVAIALALLTGLTIGLFQGVLVAHLRMNPFIATLGTATLLGGAIFAYTGGLQITQGISPALTSAGSGLWAGLPAIVVVVALLALVVWFVLDQTVFGRRLFAIGSNVNAARLIGVDVARTQLLAFAASGLVGAAAGVLLLARQGAATSDNGMTMLFPALTAVLLSTIVIDVGRPSVQGTAIGVVFVAVSTSGLTLIGSPAWVSSVFTGAALLVAVAVASLGRLRKGR
ncbi:monosaccharide ABC transporter membrane protein, CUT2 family [Quadrisphaera granulorum]|uniref:Autoinducer 2 import system permease protein LsrD n=1 Tax=Quadrisphaera granulorum TaxID=317664 RepID=A0A315ZSL3_9ACTN|nr:ABC transporter permease [Quadrisphaera granulorum]PWJ48289.1 monosaccharide ABC transporter membrane protein (CUT2 family) [Quadrisphaera granulorum]SZE98450.1 monosaccharide ABC transporter membrane protein, CUT2 family [Quadrisphaera granulorum]